MYHMTMFDTGDCSRTKQRKCFCTTEVIHFSKDYNVDYIHVEKRLK